MGVSGTILEASASILEGFGLPKPSQNLPQTRPKSRYKKTCHFYQIRHRFFVVFRCTNIEILCAQPMFCKGFRCFTFSDWDRFCIRKTSQKPLRNHPETMIKSNLQTCCFSTSIFSGFWERLGTSWVPLGLHWAPVRHLLGASWALLGRFLSALGRLLGVACASSASLG